MLGDTGYIAVTVLVTAIEVQNMDSAMMRAVLLHKCEDAYKKLEHTLGLDDGTYDLSNELRIKEK